MRVTQLPRTICAHFLYEIFIIRDICMIYMNHIHVIFIRVYVISGLNYSILLSVKIYEVYVHYFVLDLENLVAGMETRRNRFNAEMKVCYNNSLMIVN